MKRLKGFTLIELLVVISVIALLLSILMPSLNRVKQQAQAVVCRSNLKQWGYVFALFAEDHNGSFPQSIAGNGVTQQEAYWMTGTLGYYDEKKIRLCPSTRTRSEPGDRLHGGTFMAWGPFIPASSSDWWGDWDSGSYGINEWCSDPPPTSDGLYWGFPSNDAWRKLSVPNARNIPLFFDCIYVDVFPDHRNEPLDFEPPATEWDNNWGDWWYEPMRLVCIDRHNETINSVFVDTSARKVGLKELWRMKWHRTCDTSNRWTRPNAEWPEWMAGFKDYSL